MCNPVPSRRVSLFWARISGILTLLTACATLAAGIIPFDAPQNDVSRAAEGSGIVLGRHGIVLSSQMLDLAGGGQAGSIELWLQPARTWTRGSLLSVYDSSKNRLFKLQQDYTDLVLRLGDEDTGATGRVLRVKNVFRKKQPFITLAFDGQATSVYVDGELAERSTEFKLSGGDLSGQLILGNAPFRNQGWPGEIKALAVYGAELDPAAVRRQYQGWTKNREPVVEGSERLTALYLFRESSGNLIYNAVSGKPELEIPGRFLVVDQLRFESPLSEYRSQPTYLGSALFNVEGLIPLGVVLGFYLSSVCRMKRAALLTILGGAAVSFVIEYCQSFLPTRFSGCTDLITNTVGTSVGFLLQKLLAHWMTGFRPSAIPSHR